MEDVVSTLLAAAGLGVMWWQYGRRSRRRARLDSRALARVFDEDAEVIVHLAAHEAEVRGRALAPIHILFALVQDEEVAAAIRALGGDVEAIEDRIRAQVDAERTEGATGDESATSMAARVIRWAVAVAGQTGRRAGRADLWSALIRTDPPTAELVRTGDLRPVDVLVALVHGPTEQAPPDRGVVEVVLVNDDFSTKELVVEILQDVFEMAEPDARARMEQTHRSGQALVDRYPAAMARAKVDAAVALARSRGFPLRIRIEPAAS